MALCTPLRETQLSAVAHQILESQTTHALRETRTSNKVFVEVLTSPFTFFVKQAGHWANLPEGLQQGFTNATSAGTRLLDWDYQL